MNEGHQIMAVSMNVRGDKNDVNAGKSYQRCKITVISYFQNELTVRPYHELIKKNTKL